jgi:uncharacterized membrane protein
MRIFVSIFLLILFGCKSTTTKNNEVSFQTVSKGVLFGDGVEGISESNISFTNAKDWKSFLEKINTPNTFSKVTIDFSEQQLLCVFDTIRNTSGYKIEIKNILIENKGIKIIYTSAKPSAKEMVNMVITQPYHLVIINKRAEEVTFIHKDNL